jgi:Ca-activated chloride channel family protein
MFVQLECPVRYNPEVSYPPPEIVQAMSQLILYRIQEKAHVEVEKGNITAAFKRLQYLASHLMSQGNKELARIVLREAENIQRNKQFSDDGDKKIKYGTRAFLLPEGGKGIAL